MPDRRIPAETIRRVWRDPSLTTAQAAAAVGLSRSNLWRRAMALGEAPRPEGTRPVITDADAPLFGRLWLAGVMAREIARHFGCHHLTVSVTARRLGLPPRRMGGRQAGLTLEDFRALGLRERLAAAARAEDAARREAGLIDIVRGGAPAQEGAAR